MQLGRDVQTCEWMYLTPIQDLPKSPPGSAICRVIWERHSCQSRRLPWSGSPGISSPLHYDAAHNAYLQVSGAKRFFLFPHNVSSGLYPYPRLHPSTRQSMVDFRQVLSAHNPPHHASAFPEFHRLREDAMFAPMEVSLRAETCCTFHHTGGIARQYL